MRAIFRFASLALLACASFAASADDLLWQGAWTNQSGKAVQLKTNAEQCFDPGQFSNNYVLLPGDMRVIRASATTEWPICTGGHYWLVINVIEADNPGTILGQIKLEFRNSANECYLTSRQAGVTAPSVPCPPDDNTASYSVEIKQPDQYDLLWGLHFPKATSGNKTSRGKAD